MSATAPRIWRIPRAATFALCTGLIAALCWLGNGWARQHTGAAGSHNDSAHAEMSPDQSLQALLAGNAKFVAGTLAHPHQNAQQRESVAKAQSPFAVVLACADSRVAPELVFDTGLGDLFVVRVAGNIADDAVLGSIEYAVEHLGAPLIVVMGHERCGAVSATVDAVQNHSAEVPGHLGALIDPIRPAVTSIPPGDDLLDRAVEANVRIVVEKIVNDPPLSQLIKAGKVKVVGGRYDLDSGEFALLTNSELKKP